MGRHIIVLFATTVLIIALIATVISMINRPLRKAGAVSPTIERKTSNTAPSTKSTIPSENTTTGNISREKLVIHEAYAVHHREYEGYAYWTIHLIINNTSNEPVTITNITVDGQLCLLLLVTHRSLTTNASGRGVFTLYPGETYEVTFNLNSEEAREPSPVDEVFSSGETVGIIIVSADGQRYTCSVALP